MKVTLLRNIMILEKKLIYYVYAYMKFTCGRRYEYFLILRWKRKGWGADGCKSHITIGMGKKVEDIWLGLGFEGCHWHE